MLGRDPQHAALEIDYAEFRASLPVRADGKRFGLDLANFADNDIFGIIPADPPSVLAVASLVASLALAASYMPARRAMQTDPAALFA